MKRTLMIAGGSTLILALVAGMTLARDGGPRGANLFERFDTDGNGEITRAEFDAVRQTMFTDADTNGDNLLNAEELIAAASEHRSEEKVTERVNRMIERFDENDDQALSIDEMPERRADRLFDRVDADGDGIITQAEAEEMRGRHGKKKSGRKGRDG